MLSYACKKGRRKIITFSGKVRTLAPPPLGFADILDKVGASNSFYTYVPIDNIRHTTYDFERKNIRRYN